MITGTLSNPNTVMPLHQLISVFLVEDHNLTRLGLTSYFKKIATLNVVGEADNGEDALVAIRMLRPNVVLMDLGLPKMNGIEATQRVKDFDPNMKVVILTSHDTTKEVTNAFDAGANAYCLKDIDPARLVEVIQSVVAGGTWLDPAIPMASEKHLQGPPAADAIPRPPLNHKYQLTDREEEVLLLVTQGRSNPQIATDLFISIHTAKAHVCNILQKLFVSDRLQAAVKALKEGLVN